MDKEELKEKFLDTHIFYGLKNLNDGFDAPSIKYFSAFEFEIVLNRIKEFGIGVYGIEPWKNGEFHSVETYEDYSNSPTDYNWYLKVFEQFKEADEELQYSASYSIPEELLTA